MIKFIDAFAGSSPSAPRIRLSSSVVKVNVWFIRYSLIAVIRVSQASLQGLNAASLDESLSHAGLVGKAHIGIEQSY